MQRWTGFLLVALLLGAGALVVLKGGPVAPPTVPAADAGADGRAPLAVTMDAGLEAMDAGEPSDGGELEPEVDAGGTLINGQAAPALPTEAPKSVVFGVVLVQYKGAQGAPPTTRSRDDALVLATQLAALAKDDFKAAVAKGDKGSMENAGRMPRGYLEPAPEFVLFSLAKGGVSEPVDTPRGYWIVTRIE